MWIKNGFNGWFGIYANKIVWEYFKTISWLYFFFFQCFVFQFSPINLWLLFMIKPTVFLRYYIHMHGSPSKLNSEIYCTSTCRFQCKWMPSSLLISLAVIHPLKGILNTSKVIYILSESYDPSLYERNLTLLLPTVLYCLGLEYRSICEIHAVFIVVKFSIRANDLLHRGRLTRRADNHRTVNLIVTFVRVSLRHFFQKLGKSFHCSILRSWTSKF